MRFQDDVSVEAPTLDAGNVYVHTADGFNLQSDLIFVAGSEDGYANLATYRAALPGNKPSLSSLSYFLNANQVFDTSGHARRFGRKQSSGAACQFRAHCKAAVAKARRRNKETYCRATSYKTDSAARAPNTIR